MGFVRKNWPLMAALVAAISASAVSISTTTENKMDVENHERRIQKVEQAIQIIGPIREDIDELKEEQREQKKLLIEILRAVK